MKKGSATLEIMLILPIIFTLFILSIDYMFITYNRARAISEIETVRINLCEQFAQATDQSIIRGESDLVSGNIPYMVQSERGFLDAFHMWLTPDDVSATFKAGVKSQEVEFSLVNVSSRFNYHLLSPSYIINYTVCVKSPFQGVTNKVFLSYREFDGEISLPVNSYIQKMNSTQIIVDRLEKVEEIINLTKTIRRVIKQWTDGL